MFGERDKTMKEAIKKFNGQIVGYYDTDSQGNKTITDFMGRILGYYNSRQNVTTLLNHTIIARGDVSGIFFKDDIDF